MSMCRVFSCVVGRGCLLWPVHSLGRTLLAFALIHGPDIPGSYAILLFTASDLASITSHIHNWVLFLLWLHPFILSGVISPLISSSILGTYQPGEFLFQYPIAFSYCSWGSQGKNTEVACHPLLQWTTFYQTSPPWPAHLGWPHTAWLSFIELDKAVVRVIRLTSFLWLWFHLLIAKFRLKLKKQGETTRPFRYDLNQIPYDYTVEVRNRFKGLDLIDKVPDELWTEVRDIVKETGSKTIPKKMQKSKMAVWGGLTNSCEKKRSKKQRRKRKDIPILMQSFKEEQER